MKVLITGASGFVGSHLVEYLAGLGGHEIYGTVFGSGNELAAWLPQDHILPLNLGDRQATLDMLQQVQPEWIFHLAAMAATGASFDHAAATYTNNIEAQLNVLDGARQYTGLKRILVVGSAEEYGLLTSDQPVDEQTPLRPMNPYAVSKIAQDMMGLQYFLAYKVPVIRVRPFNHTGERQSPAFVVPAFAQQIAQIETGIKEPVIRVGNLDAIRDFTDVKDMVKAYVMVMEQGEPGEVYNIGSDRGVAIEEVLKMLMAQSKTTITINPDPARMRPADVPVIVADSTKFRQLTSWQPYIPLNETLSRVLNYWRDQAKPPHKTAV